MAAEYALTADALLNFGRNPPSGERALVRWASFADRVGSSILPFVIRPDRLDVVPFKALGLTPVRLSDMVPQPDEMWVLFCFKDSFREAVSPDSPLRTDGFPLVLEWRRGQSDSELLSGAFHELADRVRGQFGEGAGEWGLHPAFDRYGDAVAFTDPDLFSDSENSLQIASAWGALAVGLHSCCTKKYYGVWPFPSVQWDWEHKRAVGVAGIEKKLSVAADCKATVVTVAGEQKKETQELLARLKKSDDGGRYRRLSVLAVRNADDPRVTARKICDDVIRRVRFRRLMISVAVFLVCLMAAVVFFVIDASRTVNCYYADYVDSFGLPEGVFSLTKKEIQGRRFHYRFEYRGYGFGVSSHKDSSSWTIFKVFGCYRVLRRVVQANSSGMPVKVTYDDNYVERPAIQDFEYEQEGLNIGKRLKEIRCGRFNGEDQPIYLEKRIELYNEGETINGVLRFFVGESQLKLALSDTAVTGAENQEQAFIEKKTKSEISMHLLTRDTTGRVLKRLFLNSSGGHMADADGIYGYEYEYDCFGRMVALWYLTMGEGDGEVIRTVNKGGVSGQKWVYDGRCIFQTAYVNANGLPILGKHGWMIREESFDLFDNPVLTQFKDRKGVLRMNGQHKGGLEKYSYAQYKSEYDERGRLKNICYLNEKGKPQLTEVQVRTITKECPRYWDVPWAAQVRYEYNQEGNIIKESYFDQDGKYVKGNYAIVAFHYDECGRMFGTDYYSADGSPYVIGAGRHRRFKASSQCVSIRCTYDTMGNIVREWFLDKDGNSTRFNEDSYAEICWKYDKDGNMLKRSYHRLDGNLIDDDMMGGKYAIVEYQYDRRGDIKSKRFFNANGNPTVVMGSHEIRFNYDMYGRLKKVSWYDNARKPCCPTKFGCDQVAITYEYNESGYLTKETYVGIDDNPTSETVYRYDVRGHIVEQSCPIVYNGMRSRSRIEYKYDERGNQTSIAIFGHDGLPAENYAGCSVETKEYDRRGLETKARYYNAHGQLAPCVYGYAGWDIEYDDDGREIRRIRVGTSGNPEEINGGWAEMRHQYDIDGNLVKVRYYGVEGQLMGVKIGYLPKPVAGWNIEYDKWGNKVNQIYVDKNEKPVVMSR